MSGLYHVELRPRSLRYYRRKDRKNCAERRHENLAAGSQPAPNKNFCEQNAERGGRRSLAAQSCIAILAWEG